MKHLSVFVFLAHEKCQMEIATCASYIKLCGPKAKGKSRNITTRYMVFL